MTTRGSLQKTRTAFEGDQRARAGATPAPAPTIWLASDQLAVLETAMRRIAADHETTGGGHRKRLARNEAIRIAREACERLGWDYSVRSGTRR